MKKKEKCLSWIGFFAFIMCLLMQGRVTVKATEIIGQGELNANWVNLGLNWEMQGGTAGRVTKGEVFDVYEKKYVNGGYRYRVYARNAEIYGFISGRYMKFTPFFDREEIIGQAKLTAKWVNLGLNWEMQGGTAGRVSKGEVFDVYEEKYVNGGYRYRVWARSAGVYGFISGRYIEYIPLSKAPESFMLTEELLYKQYTEYLDNRVFEESINKYIQKGWDILEESRKDNFISAYLSILRKGVTDVVFQKIGSAFGAMSYEETLRYDSIQQLLGAMVNDDNFSNVFLDNSKRKIEAVDKVVNLGAVTSEELYLYVIELLPECTSTEAYEIVNQGKGAVKKFSNVLDDTALFLSLLQLYHVEVSVIEELMNVVDADSILYEDLKVLREKRTEDPVKYLMEYYFSKGMIRDIVEQAKKTVWKSGTELIDTIGVAEIGLSVIAEIISRGVSADEYVQAMYLGIYMNCLQSKVDEMQLQLQQKKMTGDAILNDDICKYEFVSCAYLKSVEVFLKQVSLLDDSNEIQGILATLNENYSFDDYISSCIQNIYAT